MKGGIQGSHPIHGGCAPFSYLSWAAKFFIDAILLEESVALSTHRDLLSARSKVCGLPA